MIESDDDFRRFYENISFAPDGVIRDWAFLVASTWDALEPRDRKVEPADTRDERSYGAALAIIKDFCLRQALDAPQSPEALRWLAEALQRILDHKDPLHSLGLKPRPRQRPADPELMFDVVFWVRCVGELGYEVADAKSLAADRFGKDAKTIERYLAKGTAALQWMDESRYERLGSLLRFKA